MAFDTFWVCQKLAHHLEAAANTKDRSAGGDIILNLFGHAGALQDQQIGNGSLSTGDNDRIWIVETILRTEVHHPHIRFCLKGIEVSEVGNAG